MMNQSQESKWRSANELKLVLEQAPLLYQIKNDAD